MTALASRIGRIERWRNEIDNPHPQGGRYVMIFAAEPNWPDHQRDVGLPPESNGIPMSSPNWDLSHLIVPSEFDHNPVAGLSDRQRAWLRAGDFVDVDVRVTWSDLWSGTAGIDGYEFLWPDDPGPSKPPDYSILR